MSIKPVSSSNCNPASAPQTNVLPQPSNSFWQSRMTQKEFCGLTTVEITRICMRLLSIGSGLGGLGIATAAVLGAVSGPMGLIAIPCILASVGALWYSFQFDDYENPEEMVKFRNEAARMSFEQVMQAHGWNSVLRWGILTTDQFAEKYREQMRGKNLVEIIHAHENAQRHLAQCVYRQFEHQVPSPAEWRGQWRAETAAKTFEEIIQTYPLDKLERFNLVEAGEMQRIKDLKKDFDGVKENYGAAVAPIEREFKANTEVFQRAYQSDCSRAEQHYNDNWAVRSLKAFELNHVRERQTIQGTANQRKTEAKLRFDRSVAAITSNGQIPYNNLSARDKLLYDQQNNELQVSMLTADNEARLQIANIDARWIVERTRLNAEENRVRGERAQMHNEAKARYDAAVVGHRQHKEQLMAPFSATFRSSVGDLNCRYRAYLRTIGVA